MVHNAQYPNSVDDLIVNSQPGRETKGRTTQMDKSGDYNVALDDFNSLNPTNIKDFQTDFLSGKTGNLIDGFTATVRTSGTAKLPTLEIINKSNNQRLKFRYK